MPPPGIRFPHNGKSISGFSCNGGRKKGLNTKSSDMRPDNLIGDTKDNMAELACDGQIACRLRFSLNFLTILWAQARPIVLFTPRYLDICVMFVHGVYAKILNLYTQLH